MSKTKENPIVARIWYEIANLTRYELCWEQMKPFKDGEYLDREEVLKIIEKYLYENEN